MPRLDNYPDGIRQYDDDPRSPFYVDPNEWMNSKADELATTYWTEYLKTARVDDLDLNTEELELIALGDGPSDFYEIIWGKCLELIESRPDEYQDFDYYCDENGQ